ncbi:MAG: YjgP/YjgQ family permease [Spirochaetaceae bacterium]|nr:MAG: YjgP/YjgQ family permease [Spirochaetaceae bacterium]
MRRLDRMIIHAFVPALVVGTMFFVLILQLVDLFANLVQYLNLELPLETIVLVQALFIPRGALYALPIATLFAASLTLGQLYSSNELISVFAAGIPLVRFIAPLAVVGVILSGLFFVVEDVIAIPADRLRAEIQQEVMQIGRTFSGSNVTILSEGQRVIYFADYYNDVTESLNGVVVLEVDADGRLVRRIDADWAQWDGEAWVFHRARLFFWDEIVEDVVLEDRVRFTDATLREPPATFGRSMRHVSELTRAQAWEHIASLRQAGIPFRAALTAYYERYTFALTPLVVVALSSAIGGRFKRNILLMSLLVSLALAVAYYVTGMITGLLAQSGAIPPLLGASAPVLLFLAATVVLFRSSRT